MQFQFEIDLHEDVGLQNELWHALNNLFDEHKNVEMSSQFNVKSIVACVEVGESRLFKSAFVCQLNGDPTLPKNQLTHIKAGILFMMPILLTNANHDTVLNLGCDYGVCILNTHEARIVKNECDIDPKNILQLRFDLLGGLYNV